VLNVTEVNSTLPTCSEGRPNAEFGRCRQLHCVCMCVTADRGVRLVISYSVYFTIKSRNCIHSNDIIIIIIIQFLILVCCINGQMSNHRYSTKRHNNNLIYKSECVCICLSVCMYVCMFVCSTVSKQLKNTTIKTSTVSYIVEAVGR
jgi:hypothetical protein